MPCETTGILSRHPPQSSITSKCKNRLCRKQNEAYPFIREIPGTHPENSADENSPSIGNITCLFLANPCGLRIRCLSQNSNVSCGTVRGYLSSGYSTESPNVSNNY